jgi:hypothetical protein
MDAKREFRNRLLPRTIAYAADTIPGYSYLKDAAGTVENVEDLSQLPIIDKETIMRNVALFRNSDLSTSLVQHSSGSSGSVMVVHRSAEEVEFSLRFFSALCDDYLPNPQICISLTAPSSHGAPSPFPYQGPVFSMDPFDRAWLEEAPDIVTFPSRYTDQGSDAAILTGLEPHLRILTLFLLDHDYDFSRSSITRLYSTGDLITAYRHRWYESIWGVPLVDKYSMSEILAGASICHRCGYFHFDAQVIAEAVDAFTRESVRRGLGVLVFTTLFPFIQKQPLIRYWSGDVVDVNDDCPCDPFGFQFKGRFTHCLLDRESTPRQAFLLGRDICEVLEPIPDVATAAPFGPINGIFDLTTLGRPKCCFFFDTDSLPHVVRLKVELRYSAYAFADHARNVRDRIREGILSRHPYLAAAVDSGRVGFSLELARVGELRGFRPASIRTDGC